MESALEVVLSLIIASSECKRDFFSCCCTDCQSSKLQTVDLNMQLIDTFNDTSVSTLFCKHPTFNSSRILIRAGKTNLIEEQKVGGLYSVHATAHHSTLFPYLIKNFTAMLPFPSVIVKVLNIFNATAWNISEKHLERYLKV